MMLFNIYTVETELGLQEYIFVSKPRDAANGIWKVELWPSSSICGPHQGASPGSELPKSKDIGYDEAGHGS